MAIRPVFVPKIVGRRLVEEVPVTFTWHAGLSKSQKQKSIESLHAAALQARKLDNLLEISSKSQVKAGVELSAFSLLVTTPRGARASVEVLFQGSKVFSQGGPYEELYLGDARDAKADPRLRNSGPLREFRYFGESWPLNPQTAFYDWLYISGLQECPRLAQEVLSRDGFTDIEFNPERSMNCQARSAALYKSLYLRGLLGASMTSPSSFLEVVSGNTEQDRPSQKSLF